jgi:hypothetical protein|eukprot:TRINITY_DN57127_c0_g1_i1.p1 TRINITY_DN57127_c0_g1~~TRINITY_DN57127_c0_g1_i1.p1  ORF type:complete len:402 (-),score=69.62 TRINITY_DN57127_c0_g1_i1:340-1545(-)
MAVAMESANVVDCSGADEFMVSQQAMVSMSTGKEQAGGTDQEIQQGQVSVGSTATREPLLVPTIVDIKRLEKVKAEQDLRLRMLKTRVGHLSNNERQVWKDVTWTQQMSLQTQEAQMRRQAELAQRERVANDIAQQEQLLRERARDQRQRTLEYKDVPRLKKFEGNKMVGRMVRDDSKRMSQALSDNRESERENKALQVDGRRTERRQHKLRKELEQSRSERDREQRQALKYAELQEEISSAEMAIASAERDELIAVHRLQNSQNVRNEVLTQLQAAKIGLATEGSVGYPLNDESPISNLDTNGCLGNTPPPPQRLTPMTVAAAVAGAHNGVGGPAPARSGRTSPRTTAPQARSPRQVSGYPQAGAIHGSTGSQMSSSAARPRVSSGSKVVVVDQLPPRAA